jgi:hypothetical protein
MHRMLIWDKYLIGLLKVIVFIALIYRLSRVVKTSWMTCFSATQTVIPRTHFKHIWLREQFIPCNTVLTLTFLDADSLCTPLICVAVGRPDIFKTKRWQPTEWIGEKLNSWIVHWVKSKDEENSSNTTCSIGKSGLGEDIVFKCTNKCHLSYE